MQAQLGTERKLPVPRNVALRVRLSGVPRKCAQAKNKISKLPSLHLTRIKAHKPNAEHGQAPAKRTKWSRRQTERAAHWQWTPSPPSCATTRRGKSLLPASGCSDRASGDATRTKRRAPKRRGAKNLMLQARAQCVLMAFSRMLGHDQRRRRLSNSREQMVEIRTAGLSACSKSRHSSFYAKLPLIL